jgi:hypothetical protein
VEEEGAVRTFNLQADLAQLEAKIREIGDVVLAIIDPISSYMGRVDSHKNSETRTVIEPLNEMASRLRVAVASNTHFSKTGAASKAKALHRFIGSIAFAAAPRAAFAVVADPNDEQRRLVLIVKTNLREKPPGLAYTIDQVVAGYVPDKLGGQRPLHASCVTWAGAPVELTADQAIAEAEAAKRPGAPEHDAPEREQAEEFLKVFLEDGPRLQREVQKAAIDAGLTRKTLRNAKDSLGIKPVSKRTDDGKKIEGWMWALPRDDTTDSSAREGLDALGKSRCPASGKVGHLDKGRGI